MSDRFTKGIYLRLAEGGDLSRAAAAHLGGCAACQRAQRGAARFRAELGQTTSLLAAGPMPVDLIPPALRRRVNPLLAVLATAFVALAMVVGLRVAGIVPPVGARPAPSSAVAGSRSPSPLAGPSVTPLPEPWAALDRPLAIPAFDGTCTTAKPTLVASGIGPSVGDGPIYAAGMSAAGELDFREVLPSLDGHHFQKVVWISDPTYDGPLLVRGVRLDEPGAVLFEGEITRPVLLLPAKSSERSRDLPADWRMWSSGIDAAKPGCYLLQIDGATFTEHLVFSTIPSAGLDSPAP